MISLISILSQAYPLWISSRHPMQIDENESIFPFLFVQLWSENDRIIHGYWSVTIFTSHYKYANFLRALTLVLLSLCFFYWSQKELSKHSVVHCKDWTKYIFGGYLSLAPHITHKGHMEANVKLCFWGRKKPNDSGLDENDFDYKSHCWWLFLFQCVKNPFSWPTADSR